MAFSPWIIKLSYIERSPVGANFVIKILSYETYDSCLKSAPLVM